MARKPPAKKVESKPVTTAIRREVADMDMTFGARLQVEKQIAATDPKGHVGPAGGASAVQKTKAGTNAAPSFRRGRIWA